jgi:AraC-like DNA-binding protein
MSEVQQQASSSQSSETCAFVWIDLTRDAASCAAYSIDSPFPFPVLREPDLLEWAIQRHAPSFLCVEFDESSESGSVCIEMLARVHDAYSNLPALIIAGHRPAVIAPWVARLRVLGVLIKPVSAHELSRAIGALMVRFHATERAPHAHARAMRTSAAVSYVASHYPRRISLAEAAAQCGLSASQFCRTFRKEHRLSFGEYLLRFRMQRARDRLCLPDVLVKDVAYEVGFNDLSYFTRSFRRAFGVCPSAFQSDAATNRAALTERLAA